MKRGKLFLWGIIALALTFSFGANAMAAASGSFEIRQPYAEGAPGATQVKIPVYYTASEALCGFSFAANIDTSVIKWYNVPGAAAIDIGPGTVLSTLGNPATWFVWMPYGFDNGDLTIGCTISMTCATTIPAEATGAVLFNLVVDVDALAPGGDSTLVDIGTFHGTVNEMVGATSGKIVPVEVDGYFKFMAHGWEYYTDGQNVPTTEGVKAELDLTGKCTLGHTVGIDLVSTTVPMPYTWTPTPGNPSVGHFEWTPGPCAAVGHNPTEYYVTFMHTSTCGIGSVTVYDTITVTDVNNVPTISFDACPVNFTLGTPLHLDITYDDPDYLICGDDVVSLLLEVTPLPPGLPQPTLTDNADGTADIDWDFGTAQGGTYTFKVTASDTFGGSNYDECTLEIIVGEPFELCFDCDIDIWPGMDVEIPVLLQSHRGDICGYELLIHWDCSVMDLLDVIEKVGFEYFHYTVDDEKCKLRVVSLCDKPNTVETDPIFASADTIVLFTMKFHVSSSWDMNYQICLDFETDECGDNTLSDPTGYFMWTPGTGTEDMVGLIPDCPPEWYPVSGGLGYDVWVDGCHYVNEFPNPAIELHDCCLQGTVHEVARGDINLDGEKYTVPDAVLFMEYLMYGDVVLVDGREDEQGAASDINDDGLQWTVADVCYLIDIINGYKLPLLKVLPSTEVAQVNVAGNSVSAAFDVSVGGAYFIINYDGQIGAPVLSDRAAGMDLMFNDTGNELRVLIYSWESKNISAGSGALFTIPGASDLTITEAQFSTDGGSLMKTSVSSLPGGYSLSQNYPNPFNPNTNISFDLPNDANVSLTVYNIAGEKVAELVNGQVKAGHYTVSWDASGVSSGVYLYSIKAGNFTATRKMVLMK